MTGAVSDLQAGPLVNGQDMAFSANQNQARHDGAGHI
jgi:hypothetical protein